MINSLITKQFISINPQSSLISPHRPIQDLPNQPDKTNKKTTTMMFTTQIALLAALATTAFGAAVPDPSTTNAADAIAGRAAQISISVLFCADTNFTPESACTPSYSISLETCSKSYAIRSISYDAE